MALENKAIQMYQGETKSLVFSILNTDGTIKDLTNGSAIFKLQYSGINKIIKTNGDGIVILNNKITVLFNDSDTIKFYGSCKYELRVNDTDNNTEVVSVGEILIVKSNTI